MLGVGLGGFVDGLVRGVGLKQQIEDRETAKQERAEDRAYRAEEMQFRREDRTFQQEEREFARSERTRTVENRDRLAGIQTDAREVFAEGVEEGKYKAEEFEKFYTEFALPKLRNEMILQGDVEGATALNEWSQSEAAKKGRLAFGEAMFLTQSGQHGKALDKAIEAGRTAGYIGDGYEIADKEEIEDEDGTLLGYRLTMKDADGNETVQDVALDDVPSLVTQFFNPEAAWQSQVEASTKKREREEGIADYRTKAEIDAELKPAGGASRAKAVENLRERAMAGDGEDIDTMEPEAREAAISAELELLNGTTTPRAPAGKVLVDTQSGKPMPTAEQVAAAPGLGQSPKPAAAAAPPVQDPTMQPPGRGTGAAPTPTRAPVINGQVDSGLAVPSEHQLVNQAAQEMVSGGDPQQIARRLTELQIPQEKWPSSVKQVLQQTTGR